MHRTVLTKKNYPVLNGELRLRTPDFGDKYSEDELDLNVGSWYYKEYRSEMHLLYRKEDISVCRKVSASG